MALVADGADIRVPVTAHCFDERGSALTIEAVGAPTHGGAHHRYIITATDTGQTLGDIHFQEGPLKEAGVNGVVEAALLAIVLHRLQSFNQGPARDRFTSLVITAIEQGLNWLFARERDRRLRSVEGTSRA